MFIKRLLKDFLYFLFGKLLPFKAGQAIILMYHSIGKAGEFFQVTPAEFAGQMAYLAQNDFKVISLSNLLANLRSGAGLAKKTVAITFDDGYLDNYAEAWPILRRYQFPAAIFVNTAELGQSRTARGGRQLPLLSAKEILELSRTGLVEFGSHCHHHYKLTKLSAENRAAEFSQSKKILENLLGRQAEVLAYPSGKYNEEVRQSAKKFFKACLTVEPGPVRPGADWLALKRNAVDSAVSLIQFKGLVKFGKI